MKGRGRIKTHQKGWGERWRIRNRAQQGEIRKASNEGNMGSREGNWKRKKEKKEMIHISSLVTKYSP